MSPEVNSMVFEDIEKVLASISDPFATLDREWRYTYVNDKVAELAGMQKEELLGRSIWELFPDIVGSLFYTELHQAVAEQVPRHFEYFYPKWNRWLENRVYPSASGVSVLTTDITERKRTQQYLTAQYAITRALAEAPTLADAVPTILQSLCESLGWVVGIIWSVDHHANILRCINSWHTSSVEIEDFKAFNQRTTFAPNEGLPGQAWASSQPIWIKDLAEDDNFPGAALAACGGLHTGIGFPIRLGNEILGVIECFSDRIQKPDPDLLQLMAAIGSQIGQFMERKRTEEALRESQELFESFMSNSPSTAFIKDEAGRYIYVNRLAEQTFNRHLPDWIGKTDFDVFPVEIARQWRENDLTVLATGQILKRFETAPLEDGEHHYISFKFPLRNPAGQQLVGGMSIDITERIRAEISLRESEARYRSIFETAGVSIWEEDFSQVKLLLDELKAQGVVNLREYLSARPDLVEEAIKLVKIRDVNQQSLKLFGAQTKAELLNSLAHIFVPETSQVFLEEMIALAEGRRYFESETILRTLQGEQLHVLFTIALPEPEAGYESILVSILDISERKQAEEERERLLAELEEANALLDTLFNNAPTGIGIWDEKLRFVRLNNALAEINGLPQEAHIGKTIAQLLPRVDPSVMAALGHIVKTGESIVAQEVSGETPAAPGKQRYWSVSYYPIKLPGEITWVGGICTEITARKIAEAAVRESEARFRVLAENSTDIISRHTVDGTLVYVSPASYTVLGYKPEELLGRRSYEFVHPDDLAEIALKYLINADLPDIYTIAHRGCHKDGHYIWLETTVRTIRDPQTGRILELQASSRNINQRKQAEERQQFLAQASDILASSLDYEIPLASLARLAVPAIADWCVVDIVDDNQSALRVAVAHAQPSKQELVEQLRNYPLNLSQRGGVPEVIRAGKSQLIPTICDEQIQAAVYDANHLKILQDLAPKSSICVPLLAREQVLGAITLVSSESGRRYDINDLMLAEELARRAAIAIDNAHLYREARYSQQAALQAAARTARLQAVTAALSESLTPTQVAQVIIEQSMAALGANSALVALLTKGGNELEIVHTSGLKQELVDSWRRFSIHASVPLAEAVRTKEPIWAEPTVARLARYPNLAEMYAHYNYSAWVSLPLIVEGRAVGGISFAFAEAQELSQDDRAFMLALAQQCAQAIERASLYQAEQIAREAAESANRIKDEFLAVLSHELRSPLNPILGWSNLLQNRKLDQNKTAYALQTIERNAKLQAQLIEDLLDVSRILQGKLSLNICSVDLTYVIAAALETVRLSAEVKSIDLRFTIDDFGLGNTGKNPESIGFDKELKNPKSQVLGDSSRLQQVVWNLLSNAVKFTPTGGRVEIRLERIGSFAQIVVTDTGKGIDPNFLPYVFDYFRQENSSTSRKFGGLGLGLAIVRHLVELHGGTVFAESAGEGQGSTFSVRLPLIENQSEMKHGSEKPEPSLDLNQVRILVVDDDTDTRQFITFLLEEYGASVTAVATAEEALVTLTQSVPDVLLSDIGMPEVDGYTLMRRVRTLPPEQGGQVPGVALTAYAGEINSEQALRAGFQRHIPKPVEPAELVEVIANLLGRR